jgi:anti-sigma B factor antagonist
VDAASVPAARRSLNAALTDGFETVVLDLSQTTFMDSTGVHLVLEATAHARTRGTRLIVLPGPHAVRRVFELCGVSHLLLT